MTDLEKLNEEFKRKKENNKSSSMSNIFKQIEKRILTCRFCNKELIDLKCNCQGFIENEKFELEVERTEEERRKNDHKKRLRYKKESLINSLYIPRRYKGVDLYSDWDINKTKLKDYINNIQYNVSNGKGLVLLGSEGTGKTRLSFAIGLYIASNCDIKNIDREKFYNIFKYAMDNANYYETLKKKDVLILDEVGLKQLTDWEIQITYDLLDYRNEEMKYTIITTNATKEELSNFIGKRSYKRLVESCEFVEFNGKSRRDK